MIKWVITRLASSVEMKTKTILTSARNVIMTDFGLDQALESQK